MADREQIPEKAEAGLSDRLVAELTTHRTLALRDALAQYTSHGARFDPLPCLEARTLRSSPRRRGTMNKTLPDRTVFMDVRFRGRRADRVARNK